MSDTLYINMARCVKITHQDVTVGDIAKLECKNPSIVNKIKPVKLISDKPENKRRYVISVMKIIEIVDEKCQNVDICNIGQTDCVVEFGKSKETVKVLEIAKVAAICVILFFGAGFSIMSFNNDVSITKMFNQVCTQITGSRGEGVKIMELFYSIGLALGIIVFYNHFGSKKITTDPSPIETEMRKYEKEINDAIVEDRKRNGKNIDMK